MFVKSLNDILGITSAQTQTPAIGTVLPTDIKVTTLLSSTVSLPQNMLTPVEEIKTDEE